MLLKKVEGHSELLEAFLFDVVAVGTGVVSEEKLRRWTDTKRITAKMWRLVHQLFDDVLEETEQHKHGYRLYIGELADSYVFLMWDRGEGDGRAEHPWWNSIESYEETKPRGRTVKKSVSEAGLAVKSDKKV